MMGNALEWTVLLFMDLFTKMSCAELLRELDS